MRLQQIASWVARILGLDNQHAAFRKQEWSVFASLPNGRYERTVSPEELVDIAQYRRDARIAACKGHDPLLAIPAYAQDSLVYDAENRLQQAPDAAYAATPYEVRVNKFGKAYKQGAPVLLHRTLADIMVDAAVDLYNDKKWNTVVFDGLRTMEGGYLLYRNAQDQWLQDGLLSAPGKSAHNRGLAADTALFDDHGREIDMGAHFDHADMKINNRTYSGNEISESAKENRLIRERAVMAAALKRGTVAMPLREEFWHDQVPGTPEDLWRVIESICRCIGQTPPQKAERARTYEAFAAQWKTLDKGKLSATFGDAALKPPAAEHITYHEKLKPIYDRELPPAMRQALITPEMLKPGTSARAA